MKVIKILEKEDTKDAEINLATFYHNAALDYRELGKPETAKYYLIKSIEILEERQSDIDNLIRYYEELADIYENYIGDNYEAVQVYEKIVIIYQVEYPNEEFPFYEEMARNYQESNLIDEALAAIQAAIQTYEKTSTPLSILKRAKKLENEILRALGTSKK